MGVFGIAGIGGDGKPAVGTPTRSNLSKIPLVPLGTFTLKDIVFGRLRIKEPGQGFCHFPKRYGADYYKGLTAEEVRVKYNKGFPVREWHKKSESIRNEPLDCRVYATAAYISLDLNMEQLAQVIAGTWQEPDNSRRIRGELAPAG